MLQLRYQVKQLEESKGRMKAMPKGWAVQDVVGKKVIITSDYWSEPVLGTIVGWYDKHSTWFFQLEGMNRPADMTYEVSMSQITLA